MLQLHNFTFNPFQENTYLISNEKNECWILDPGMSNPNEEREMVAFIEQNKLTPKAIINTHAHIDHILGIDFLVSKYAIPFLLHEKELPILNNASNTAKMFGFDYEGVKSKVTLISESTPLLLGLDKIIVKLIPGHSPGSIAFYSEANNWVVSGDALFAGSIGRTDLLMGDLNTLLNSIKTELLTLPEETVVYSGHGPTTKIIVEKKTNPFLQ